MITRPISLIPVAVVGILSSLDSGFNGLDPWRGENSSPSLRVRTLASGANEIPAPAPRCRGHCRPVERFAGPLPADLEEEALDSGRAEDHDAPARLSTHVSPAVNAADGNMSGVSRDQLHAPTADDQHEQSSDHVDELSV